MSKKEKHGLIFLWIIISVIGVWAFGWNTLFGTSLVLVLLWIDNKENKGQ